MGLMRLTCFITLLWLMPRLVWAIEPPALADDFIKCAGEISFIGQYTRYETSHFWNSQGSVSPAHNRLRQDMFELFAEYGLTSCDTLGVYGGYAHNRETMNGSARGFKDAELCWKRLWTEVGNVQISSRLMTVIPTNDDKFTIRYGRFGAEVDLHAQWNFTAFSRCGWIEGLAGYRYYSGFPSDLIKANLIIGYSLCAKFRTTAALYLDYGTRLKGHDYGPVLTLPPRYRVLKGQVIGIWNLFDCLQFYAGGFYHLWGKKIGSGGGAIGGIWIDF